MMKYEDRVMQEIHKIREENYYATKDLSSKEYAEKINKNVEKAAKRYGFKIVRKASSCK